MLNACRVLDLTNDRGMLCGQLLADLGADVVTVEPPGGSPVRQLGPFFKDRPGPERSIYWCSYNRNKRGITLDLEAEAGRAIFRRLAASAHFIVESDQPGYLTQLGLGYEDLRVQNPGLIYVSITPFGQDGPKAGYADSDLIIMAAGGPLILYGDEDRAPIRMSVPQAYLHASVDAAGAALIAYYERLESALGQHVDVAAEESVALAAQSTPLAAAVHGEETRRMAGGAKMGPIRIPLVWPANDGQVTCVVLFGSGLGPFTRKLMEFICAQGHCDEATRDIDWISFGGKLLSGAVPMSEYERVQGVVAGFMKSKTKAELFEIARANNLLIAPVSTIDDVLANPQFIAREYWQDVAYPEAGAPLHYPGPFVRFSKRPITYRMPPPRIGEHNNQIYHEELGIGERELAELARKGVI
jgi:crotonobetainyl-CoA:carnitine CoA-transferase CaiB-like acyl-CoA transferase